MNIKELAAMDDAALSKAIGYDKKLADARKSLDEMDKLEGKAREYAEDRVAKMFEPHVYPEDFNWIVEDAKRSTKTGKEEACDCCCRSVL